MAEPDTKPGDPNLDPQSTCERWTVAPASAILAEGWEKGKSWGVLKPGGLA